MGEAPSPVALTTVITGRVQGVYYRVFVERHARALKLCGYVRNRRDLSVEVYAEGAKEPLEKLLEYLRQGPPGARVDNIETKWQTSPGKYTGFEIVP